jgi:hypothetical protein
MLSPIALIAFSTLFELEEIRNYAEEMKNKVLFWLSLSY